MTREIGLFPLNTVLFPGALLPVKIFEKRYLDMVNDCLDTGKPFGISLILSGPEVGGVALPHKVGCLADIQKVKRLKDGCIDLMLRGGQRFEIVEELQREPHWRVQVEMLNEPEGDELQLEQCRQALRAGMKHYANLFMMITSKQLEYDKKFEDATVLSYFVADLLQGDNGDKQDLLQAESASIRLEMETVLLEREVERLKLLWEKYKHSEN